MTYNDVLSAWNSELLPEVENVITMDQLDDRLADINRMISAKGRFFPKTIEASIEASEEFLELLNKFMEQKLLLTKKCVRMSKFVEDLHSFTALAITPALILSMSVLLVCYSENYFPLVPFFSTVIMSNVLDELKPFIYFCFIPSPLYVYFLWVYLVKGRPRRREKGDSFAKPAAPSVNDMGTFVASMYPKLKDWSGSFDEAVIGTYPKLEECSETFRDNKKREDVLFQAWSLTAFAGMLFLATKPEVLFVRTAGLLLIAGVNYLIGIMLVKLSDFSYVLHEFYSPLETKIRVMSFSPLFYTILGTFGSLFIPILSEKINYNRGRQVSVIAIQNAEEKLQGIQSVQAVMRNVRELLKVTSHVQTLAEGLSERKIDRVAGCAIASEGTKLTGKIIRWTGNKIMERMSSPELSDRSHAFQSPPSNEMSNNAD